MRFLTFDKIVPTFKGLTVAVVGSAPSIMENKPGVIDEHEVIVRVNNYKLGGGAGRRTDVFYSFFGSSIKKKTETMRAEGVRLCMCKCPNSKPIISEWHERNGMVRGIDFRHIYNNRRAWWFCDTYIPDNASFMQMFNMLGKHIPTTGFSAILEVLRCEPKKLYVTGFDFFTSGIHNVNERWKPGRSDDPIGHRPELEMKWLIANREKYPMVFDEKLNFMMARASQ